MKTKKEPSKAQLEARAKFTKMVKEKAAAKKKGLKAPAKRTTAKTMCRKVIKVEGLKVNGQLKKGYKYKGGKVVKVVAPKNKVVKKGLNGSFSELKTITGRNIKIRSNKSARTFTIVTDGGKYRTYPVSRKEFQNMEYMTGNDWQQFLKSDDYYTVK
jgi:hypothetical protein